MNSTPEYYPFLMSRSYDFDYRVIVAPDFTLNDNLLSKLLEATGDEGKTDSGQILHRQVRTSPAQGFTLIFRVEFATRRSLQEKSSEVLRDNGFRPIHYVLGLVVPKIVSESQVKITDEDFKEVHRSVTGPYKNFWHQKTLQIVKSEKFSREQGDNETFLKVISLPPIDLYKRREPIHPSESTLETKLLSIQELLSIIQKTKPLFIVFLVGLLLVVFGSRAKDFFLAISNTSQSFLSNSQTTDWSGHWKIEVKSTEGIKQSGTLDLEADGASRVTGRYILSDPLSSGTIRGSLLNNMVIGTWEAHESGGSLCLYLNQTQQVFTGNFSFHQDVKECTSNTDGTWEGAKQKTRQ